MSNVRAYLRLQTLEGREVPAVVGLPWGNGEHLTVSFAPDGTDVAGQTNKLTEKFSADPNWQTAILSALQLWAVQANVNFAVHADGGQPFGAAGAGQSDARFGDIRIAATFMSGESVSVSAPHDPFLAGTWAGDMVFNTQKSFGGADGADLFSTAVHEAGHILGLGHDPNPKSVMFSHLGEARTKLSQSDITNIRKLYGARVSDKNEHGSGNGSIATATQINANSGPGKFDGETPLAIFGDIKSTRDRDMFEVRPPDNYTGATTFRLQTAGISLLSPSLSVYDRFGRVVGSASSTTVGGDTLKLTLNSVERGRKYYARVDGATDDVFGIGTFALAVTFDELNEVPEATTDAILRGPYSTLSPSELRLLFDDPNDFLDDDEGSDDDVLHAARLATSRGFQDRTHYEVLASVGTATDIDTYWLRTPQWSRNQRGVLTATVWSLTGTTPPTVLILDRNGTPVAAEILANGNGTYTVQARNIEANQRYFVQLGSATAGNYNLVVDLTKVGANVVEFASGSLTVAEPNAGKALYVAQSQLFRFILSVPGTAGSVRMTVLNSQGNSVYTITAAAGQTVTGPAAFLKGGAYAVIFEGLDGAIGYVLRGAALTIPIGPVTTDPSGRPVFTLPDAPPGQYVYPPDLIGYDAFLANLIAITYQIVVQGDGSGTPVDSTSPFGLMDLFQL